MLEVSSSTKMSIPNEATFVKCAVDMETEICRHGCNVEWRIHNFERLNTVTSKDIKPPGCDYSWQLSISPLNKRSTLIKVGFQLKGKELDKLPFYAAVNITLQNTTGDVFCNEAFEKPSSPQSFPIGRPSSEKPLIIPGSDGDQFRLARDGVLVFKAAIVSRGCCAKNKDVQHTLEVNDILEFDD